MPIPHCPCGHPSEPADVVFCSQTEDFGKDADQDHKTKQVVFTLTVNVICPLFQKARSCCGLIKPGSVQDRTGLRVVMLFSVYYYFKVVFFQSGGVFYY